MTNERSADAPYAQRGGLLLNSYHYMLSWCRRQQHGPGAMITFYIKGDLSNAKKFLENLKLFILAESLGAGQTGPSTCLQTRLHSPPLQPSGHVASCQTSLLAERPDVTLPLFFLRLSWCAQWRAWRSLRR